MPLSRANSAKPPPKPPVLSLTGSLRTGSPAYAVQLPPLLFAAALKPMSWTLDQLDFSQSKNLVPESAKQIFQLQIVPGRKGQTKYLIQRVDLPSAERERLFYEVVIETDTQQLKKI